MSPRPALGDSGRLTELLQPIVHAEIATIAALEKVMMHEDEPGYVMLYQTSKTTKQASVEQIVTLLRMAGERPSEKGGMLATALKLQTDLLTRLSTTAGISAMRLVEEEIVARYRDAHEKLEGYAREALARPLHRAVKRLVVLTAHVAQRRDGDAAMAAKLPLPLGAYFASAEDRVCMRCLFDRPGADRTRPALERSDPRPHQYLCAACHAEVLADFPPDLHVQADRWPASVREDRVIERALGKPQKLRAERGVMAELSGLAPDLPAPAASFVDDSPPVTRRGERADHPPSRLDVPRDGATELELAYTDLLFDYRSVRASW